MNGTVITGLGVVAPSGLNVEEHWAATLSGRQCVSPIASFDTSGYQNSLAGQVTGFVPAEHIDARIVVQTDRWTWFSLATAAQALADAAYDPAAQGPYETGVIMAAGSGGNEFGQNQLGELWTNGPAAVSAYQSIAWFYAASTGQTSIRHQTKGPSGVFVSEATGGLASVAQGRRVVRRGTGAVIAGGTEAGITPYAITCQATSGRLTAATTADRGYKPFDTEANGYAPGEGGASFIVESEARATARSAPRIYGAVAGYGATHDGYDYQDPQPDPRYYAMAMRQALRDAGLTPDDIDVVYADGAGTQELDRLEILAMKDVFGGRTRPVPVTAPQGLIGRLSAGGSALNVVNALLSMRDGVVPAVGNLDNPRADGDLEFVRETRELPVRTVMINSRGYGGFNSSLILSAPAAA